ncbi:MAG: hypothetical protein KGL19_08050 [Bacteroidota bacterium]|nr:hypothetical protein [Bacteroidota bacterium]
MRYILMLVITSTINIISYAQCTTVANNSNQPICLAENVKQFINYFRNTYILTNIQVVVLDSIRMNEMKECTNTIFADTLISSSDKIDIERHFNNPIIKKWSDSLINNIHIMKTSEYNEIFKNYDNAWELFYQKYKISNFFAFSAPIFFHNNTKCIFYYESICRGLCGFGYTLLFIKENGVWKLANRYCKWES